MINRHRKCPPFKNVLLQCTMHNLQVHTELHSKTQHGILDPHDILHTPYIYYLKAFTASPQTVLLPYNSAPSFTHVSLQSPVYKIVPRRACITSCLCMRSCSPALQQLEQPTGCRSL